MVGLNKVFVSRAALPIVGAIMLLVAVVEFLQVDKWLVWLMLTLLLGGFSLFGYNSKDAGEL